MITISASINQVSCINNPIQLKFISTITALELDFCKKHSILIVTPIPSYIATDNNLRSTWQFKISVYSSMIKIFHSLTKRYLNNEIDHKEYN